MDNTVALKRLMKKCIDADWVELNPGDFSCNRRPLTKQYGHEVKTSAQETSTYS